MRIQRQLLRSRLALSLALAAAILAVAVPSAMAAKIRVDGGSTLLRLDRGTVGELTKMKIAVSAVAPARAGRAATFSFPVSRGSVDSATLAGAISHRGGLSLSKGNTRVNVTGFIIRTGKRSYLTARLGRARIELADLDLSAAKVTKPRGQLVISGVRATLTKAAADALNAAFKTQGFAAGMKVATATVRARVAR